MVDVVFSFVLRANYPSDLISPILFSSLANSKDSDSIRHTVLQYTKAWNDHDGVLFAKDFSEQADFVNVFGQMFSGKKEIEMRYEKIHATFLKESSMRIMSIRLREMSPGNIVGHVAWELDDWREPSWSYDRPVEKRYGIFTQIFVKEGEKWFIQASQNTFSTPYSCSYEVKPKS